MLCKISINSSTSILNNIQSVISELLSLLVDVNDLAFFAVTIEFSADLALEMGDIDAATFLFNSTRIVSTFTENHSKKAKVLLCLAKCARMKAAYSDAKRLLKKSLQYAWHAKECGIELEIYDEMGRNYH